jgi:hypothetical protein
MQRVSKVLSIVALTLKARIENISHYMRLQQEYKNIWEEPTAVVFRFTLAVHSMVSEKHIATFLKATVKIVATYSMLVNQNTSV